MGSRPPHRGLRRRHQRQLLRGELCGVRATATVAATATSPPRTCNGLAVTIQGTDSSETLIGTSGNDVLCGGDGRDRLFGGAGRDRLFGRAGRDRLFGEKGRDALNGGTGRDRCDGGGGTDTARRCEVRVGVP
jgi:Ca2+-binding RTX toxin-like protein